jgi:7,8-dihydroneopterin aldolase/epimerase/oxygenase
MKIHIEGMEFYAYHGLLEEETRIGGRFIVDLVIVTDFSLAAETDNIEGTVNYSQVYDLVAKEMQIPSKLIEHVAQRIQKSLLGSIKGIDKLIVKLTKIRPPVNGVMERVSVVLE